MMKYKKVYVPVLFRNEEHIVDGEEHETELGAEQFGICMAEEFLEETGDTCFIKIETRIVFY